jgi:uncharacterized membrane protein
MLSFSLLQWFGGALVAAFAVLAGLFGWEKRRNRKLEAEQKARLDAINSARLEGISRMRKVERQYADLPDVKPSRRDDFEKP